MDVVAILDDDDREDGEIVDDFEDISDCSIPSVGKCDNELLRAISLSSISDSADERSVRITIQDSPQPQQQPESDEPHIPQHRKRKRKHRQRRYSPQAFVDLATNHSSSDEESTTVDKDTLRKLKEAVNIDNHNEHHNSLRSRLKAMINNVPSCGSDDEEIETLRTLALLSNSKTDDKEIIDEDKPEPDLVDILDDRELLELRSAALKSAVMKKHQDRKKRKELVVDNKENTIINDIVAKDVDSNTKQLIEKEADNKTSCESAVTTPLQENKDASIEEDVDIMRAMLLASMSKKITNKRLPAINNNNHRPITKRPPIRNNVLQKPVFVLAPVKPLIIKINNDSDSESDVKSPRKRPIEDPISQSVTEFLKLRRQQFEAKENNQNVAEIAPQSENPSNGLVLTSNNVVSKQVRQDHDLRKDISGVKLLSKAQQQEYQLLKRKLLLAKQKKLIAHIKSNEVRKRADHAKKTPQTLKETLADLQFRDNGRLRVKGKYGSLAGLLQLVNGASVERQQCETHMKRLLDELTTTKAQLGQTHRKFTNLVQRLIRAKNNIDARCKKMAAAKVATAIPVLPSISLKSVPIPLVTSTPKKVPVPETKLKISDIISETKAVVQYNETSELAKETEIKISSENETELIVEKDKITQNVVDALPKIQGSLKYTSPLDNRMSTSDPLGTICPYELFGDCKDASCNFVHCGKS